MRQQRLSAREKELCVLAVLSVYDSPYVHYAHSEIAVCVGFTRAQVQTALHGRPPSGVDGRESTVYCLALELAKSHRPMDDATFEIGRAHV